MATAATVHLTPQNRGGFSVNTLSNESASKASELLQQNHENYHIYFNHEGYHNHIVHHLLAIYALGASSSELKRGFDDNKGYQRPPQPVNKDIVAGLHDPSTFRKHLNDETHYHDYLVFFQDEIAKKGYQDIIKEYLLAGDDRADDFLGRLYAGFLHPIIHLGYGVEFEQPVIIAEALAQTAVHDVWTGDMLRAAEQKAKEIGNPKKSLFELFDEARHNPKLRKAAHFEDPNKIRDGILVQAKDEMLDIVGQYQVAEEDLDVRVAEMINLCAYYTCAAQRPSKQVKMDFFLMHAINCSIFFPSLISVPWLSASQKARLLEWKVRLDLTLFISRGCPDLLINEIRDYVPKMKGTKGESWQGLFERICGYEGEDGHAAKFVRALANGEKACGKFEKGTGFGEGFRVKGEDWVKMGNMVVDSVEAPGPRWVRSAGFDEAWESFGDRQKAQL